MVRDTGRTRHRIGAPGRPLERAPMAARKGLRARDKSGALPVRRGARVKSHWRPTARWAQAPPPEINAQLSVKQSTADYTYECSRQSLLVYTILTTGEEERTRLRRVAGGAAPARAARVAGRAPN